MSKKLPGIYKDDSFKHINNKTVFYTSNKSISTNSNNIRNNDFNSINYIDEYIFNIPVIIETYDEMINTKILSKVGDHILTINNKIIKLKDIKSIKKI